MNSRWNVVVEFIDDTVEVVPFYDNESFCLEYLKLLSEFSVEEGIRSLWVREVIFSL